tara:strand:- start:543 stop:707 length:165 start_codon:yes stop_codon:yes gene_type:complete
MDKIEKQIASAQNYIKARCNGNSSHVKMKKYAIELKIRNLKNKLAKEKLKCLMR